MKKFISLLILSILVIQCSSNRLRRPSGGNASAPGTGSIDENGNPIGAEDAKGSVNGSTAVNMPQAGRTLIWKRYRPLETGLMAGLGLTKDQLCTELGTNPCIDKVHLTVLGGNEPFLNGQYERAQTPTVLTAVAVDRVVLSSCGKRVELDRTAGAAAQIFKFFPLTAAKPSDDQVKQQATELYHRLLAREPEAAELDAIVKFAASSTAGDKIALSLCFAIGSSAENIFL